MFTSVVNFTSLDSLPRKSWARSRNTLLPERAPYVTKPKQQPLTQMFSMSILSTISNTVRKTGNENLDYYQLEDTASIKKQFSGLVNKEMCCMVGGISF